MEEPHGVLSRESSKIINTGNTGERQRISIARAIMKDSPVIFLDEATANVDPENKAQLMKAIDELTREKTVVMIAHRLKTVENADQILVMPDRGKIEYRNKNIGLLFSFADKGYNAVITVIGVYP